MNGNYSRRAAFTNRDNHIPFLHDGADEEDYECTTNPRDSVVPQLDEAAMHQEVDLLFQVVQEWMVSVQESYSTDLFAALPYHREKIELTISGLVEYESFHPSRSLSNSIAALLQLRRDIDTLELNGVTTIGQQSQLTLRMSDNGACAL